MPEFGSPNIRPPPKCLERSTLPLESRRSALDTPMVRFLLVCQTVRVRLPIYLAVMIALPDFVAAHGTPPR
jgi:hypothetical protein